MSRRRSAPLLVLALALSLGLLWRSLASAPPGEASQALEVEFEPRAAAPDSGEELAAAPEVSRVVEDPRREARTVPRTSAAAPAEFEIPADALWIEGRVVLPTGLPADERMRVVARGRKFGGVHSPRRHRARPDAPGNFRVAFASGTPKGRLRLEARYLYLSRSLWFAPTEPPREVTLEPLLGGILRGTVAPPVGFAAGAAVFEGATVRVVGGVSMRATPRSADVAPDGSFELLALEPDEGYRVILESPRFAGNEWWQVPVGAGEVRQLQLTLTPGARVVGQIHLPSGAPVRDAEVSLRMMLSTDRGEYVRYRSVRSDGRGRFVFEAVRPCSAELTIRSRGALEFSLELGLLADGDMREDLVCELSLGRSVSGVVTWEDGSPAAGAQVVATPIENDGELSTARGNLVAMTDEQGSFEVTGLEREKVALLARAEPAPPDEQGPGEQDPDEKGSVEKGNVEKGNATRRRRFESEVLVVSPDTHDARLVLSAGHTLRGSLRDPQGRPLGPFRVIAKRTTESDADSVPRRKAIMRNFRGESGEFEIEGLPHGTWELRASGRGFWDEPRGTIRLPSAERLDLVGQRGASLRGRVVSREGEPIRGALVTRRLASGSQRNFGSRYTDRTSRNGRFVLRSIEPGTYSLSTRAEGWAPGPGQLVQLSAGEERAGLVLIMSAPASVSGVLLPGWGDLARRRLSLDGGDVSTHVDTETDAGGRFEFEDLPAGHYTLQLQPELDDHVPAAVSWANSPSLEFDLAVGEALEVVLGEGPRHPIRLHGLLHSGDSAAPGYLLLISRADREPLSAARSDENGRYELVVDGPGVYRATVRPSASFDPEYLVFDFEVAGADEQRQDFALATTSLAVVLLGPDGEPAAGAGLELLPVDPAGRPQPLGKGARTDDAGRFEFPHVPAGTYLLSAGGARSWASEGLLACEVVELELDGDRELSLRLEPGATLRGVATNPDGSPAAWCRVAVLDPNGNQVSRETRSDGAGKFDLRGLPGGTLTVRLSREGALGETTLNLTPGGTAEVVVSMAR